jgi:hypothetical protein
MISLHPELDFPPLNAILRSVVSLEIRTPLDNRTSWCEDEAP